MKKYCKSIFFVGSFAIVASVILTSCSSLANVSESDAYNFGYYSGKVYRSMRGVNN